MGEVDWQKIYEATSKENRPTPGYLFNEIVRDISHADPRQIPPVAQYLADCVDGDHAHVKLKALFVIKAIAYRVPPFCQCMQEHLTSVQEAIHFEGPPSALYGDEPYRLVREAAEGALDALTSGEHYHEQYRTMSQRIVGFGNYQPGDETVLADGSVNLGITYREVVSEGVGAVKSGVGAILGGVTEMLKRPFQAQVDGIVMDECDEPCDGLQEQAGEEGEEFETAEAEDDDSYRPSVGSYIPPSLPDPAQAWANTSADAEEEWENIWTCQDADLAGGTNVLGHNRTAELELEGHSIPGGDDQHDNASMMRLLGLDEPTTSGTRGSSLQHPLSGHSESLVLSEEKVLETLSLERDFGGSDGIEARSLFCEAQLQPSTLPSSDLLEV